MSKLANLNDFVVALGYVAHMASINELLMQNAFRIIAKVDTRLARAIFYTLDSFPGKKALLNRVCEEVGDKQDAEHIRALIAAAEKANNQRRELAHALALLEKEDSTSPIQVFTPKSSDRPKMVTVEWLEHLKRYAHDAVTDGYRAFEKLCRKHGVPETPEF